MAVPVGVAILGLGTIGTAVARTIDQQGDLIAKREGRALEVRAVLEREPGRLSRADLPTELFVADLDTILRDECISVVVEVLGREQPAADYMARAFRAGKHVVTANKEALSKHFGSLMAEARAAERALLFEASVGGGIPLMVAYRQILADNRIEQLRGIVNGTTNFILSQMTERGTSYAGALSEAQQLGYAEPDSTADVEGYDAAYKLAILASLMTGRHVHPGEVRREGISGVTPDDIQRARREGGTLKLIARAEQTPGGLDLSVAPEVVPGDNLLAHVSANFNALELVGDRVGPVILYGQGAGPLPTASAVVSDIVEAVRIGAASLPPWRS